MATITKRPSGYQVKIRMKGHPAASASFDKRSDAVRWATTTEAAMREKRYFKTSESQRHTLAELIDRYIRDVIPGKGASESTDFIAKGLFSHWGFHSLSGLQGNQGIM